VFDSASILIILVIYLVILVRPSQLSAQAQSSLTELNRAGVLLFAGILGLIFFLYYLKTKPAVIRKWIGKIERILPSKIAHSIDDILDSFIHGLSILHDVRTLWKITYYSLFFWIMICAGVWAGIRAYVPDFHFFGTFLIVPLLAIGIAVPTPGGIGSYHYACQLGLTRFFDVAENSAAAVALVSHALTFIPITILGVFLLWREGLNAVKIQKMTQNKTVPDVPSGEIPESGASTTD
jgi:glycosyltransferase 2 family protein